MVIILCSTILLKLNDKQTWVLTLYYFVPFSQTEANLKLLYKFYESFLESLRGRNLFQYEAKDGLFVNRIICPTNRAGERDRTSEINRTSVEGCPLVSHYKIVSKFSVHESIKNCIVPQCLKYDTLTPFIDINCLYKVLLNNLL